MAEVGRDNEDIGRVGEIGSKVCAEGALGFGGCVSDHYGDEEREGCDVVVASGVSGESSKAGGKDIQ